MKVTQIISSKDRPAQLDLLLRSCRDNWPGCNETIVLYKASNDRYREGYDKLISKYCNFVLDKIRFLGETNFSLNIKSLIFYSKSDYILMNSDDNVFINKISDLPKHMPFVDVAFSLRLSDCINYCLPARLDINIPRWVYDGYGIISWDWTKQDPRGAYGYPQPYDSNIYRKEWLIDLLDGAKFKNPYELEIYMNNHRDLIRTHMTSFKESKLISLMVNTTGQNDNPNMVGSGQSLEKINDKWLEGYRISARGLYGMRPTQCHIYWKYEFKKGK